jgi:hypothetical protein
VRNKSGLKGEAMIEYALLVAKDIDLRGMFYEMINVFTARPEVLLLVVGLVFIMIVLLNRRSV